MIATNELEAAATAVSEAVAAVKAAEALEAEAQTAYYQAESATGEAYKALAFARRELQRVVEGNSEL